MKVLQQYNKEKLNFFAIIIILFLILVGALFFLSRSRDLANRNAEVARSIASTLSDLQVKYDKEKAENTKKISSLENDVKKLTERLARRPVPPPPGNPPAETLPLATDLKALGYSPTLLVVPTSPTQVTTLRLDDGQLAWTHAKEAGRVPGLLERDEISQNLIKTQGEEITVLKDGKKLTEEQLGLVKKEVFYVKEEAAQVKKAYNRERTLSKTEKVVYSILAFLAGMAAGKRL